MRAVLLALLPAGLAFSQCIPNPSSVRLETVQVRHAPAIDLLVHLAVENGVCLGIETRDRDWMERRMDADLSGLTVAAVIARILPGVDIEQQNNVAVLRDPPSAGRNSWLDTTVHDFTSPQQPLQMVDFRLHLAFLRSVNPASGGLMGSIGPAASSGVVGPFTEKERSLRDLLCLITAGSRGAMWVADGETAASPNPPRPKFWTIYQYEEGPAAIARRISAPPRAAPPGR